MMGRWIGQAGRELLAEADALVPVPLHWRRLWARRFNQSAMLAVAVSRQTGVPVAAGALKRVKPTAQQVGCRGPNAPPTSKARFVCPATARPP
jgi:predicted amidophosphoribosyltransferase